jgi:tetratricopeptide (TPR) repeat protein
VIVGAAAALIAASIAAVGWAALRPAAVDPCAAGAARVADAWGPARQQAVHSAFATASAPGAEETFQRTRAALDDYAARWSAMHLEACRATRVEGRQSDSMMDLRMECLERRRAVLGNLTALWSKGIDADTLEHAPDAVSSLGSLRDCADTRALADRTPLPTDAARLARVQAVRQRLDEVAAQVAAHHLAEGRKAAGEARAEAEKLDFPPLAAEATFTEGDVLASLQDPSAEAPLTLAVRLATASHDDRLAARALVRLVDVLGAVKQNAERALLAADLAAGEVARVGDDQLETTLLYARGNAQLTAGKIDDASATLEQARDLSVRAFGATDRHTLLVLVALAEVARQKGHYDVARRLGEETLAATVERLGPEHPQVIRSLEAVSASAADGGDREGAADYLRRAVALSEKISGPDSALTAAELFRLGAVLQSISKIDEAEPILLRALAIRRKVLPPDDPLLGATLLTLGSLRSMQGRVDEALDLNRQALELWMRAYGPNHPRIAISYHKIGLIYLDGGDPKSALGWFQKALDLREHVLGPDHEMTLFTRTLVGSALAELHRCAEARPLLDKTADALAKTVGESHPDFIGTLGPRGECDLGEGKPAEAVLRMTHAMELEQGPNHGLAQRGEDRFVLARALWVVGRRREAVEAAHKAIEELRSEPGNARIAGVDRWLQTHL